MEELSNSDLSKATSLNICTPTKPQLVIYLLEISLEVSGNEVIYFRLGGQIPHDKPWKEA